MNGCHNNAPKLRGKSDPPYGHRGFTRGVPVEVRAQDVEGFAPVLESVLGKQAVQETLSAEGAFGLPWFQCTNSEVKTEGFWGIDHLGVVADFLGLDRSRDSGFRALL
ncbi:hypothetical protein VI817_009960 [Penicillium citrinum]|nr:hypothetical protein VI817_009960 [Penicillium citrinum]